METIDTIINVLSDYVVRAAQKGAEGRDVEMLPRVAHELLNYIEIKNNMN